MSSETITRNDLKNILNELLPIFYPIGSYYETSDLSFNPNIEWGGRWELETGGQFHMSSGLDFSVSGAFTNTSDGGSRDLIVPYHNHTQNSHNHTQNAHYHTYVKENLTTFEESGSGTKHNQPASTSTVNSGSTTATNIAATATNNPTGEDPTDANLPPYIVVNRWHRMPDTYFTLNLGSDTRTFYFTGTPTWGEFIASQWNIDSVFSADAEDKVMYDMSSWLLTENDAPVEITDNVSTGTYLVEMPE